MNFNNWYPGVNNELEQAMPHLVFNTRTHDLGEYTYRENGAAFAVVFEGVNTPIPTCELLDSDTNPITGNSPQLTVTTIREYGVNRYWDVIPYEYLMADMKEALIEITVDGLEAICPTMDCSYAYVADDADMAISSQTLNGLTLTVGGIKLPKWGSQCDVAGARRMLFMTQNFNDYDDEEDCDENGNSEDNQQGDGHREEGFGSKDSNEERYNDNER